MKKQCSLTCTTLGRGSGGGEGEIPMAVNKVAGRQRG